jgi:O-antigen ligase
VNRAPPRRAATLLALAAPAAAAACFLPPTVTGLAVLATALLALFALPRGGWAALGRTQPLLWALAAWMALTWLWTPADPLEALRHWLRYAVLLAVPLLALAVPPAAARRALLVFAAAAGVLAAMQLAGVAAWVPVESRLGTLFHYRGNKSIALAALMALAAALAAHAALARAGPGRADLAVRVAMALAALLAAAALLQGSASRTGWVMLAAAGLWLAATQVRGWRSALGAGALVLVAAGAMAAFVQHGSSGLALREAAGQLDESNRQRLALYAATLDMVRERPLLGHGVGSWEPLWQQRPHDAALAPMNTAHMDWLQTAQQGGLPAAVLLAALMASWVRQGLRSRGGLGFGDGARGGSHDGDGHECRAWPGAAPVVLFVGGWALLAAMNAAVRDFAFAAPMALMCGLSLAAARAQGDTSPVAATLGRAAGHR